jgi:Mn-dependent DtxR family transcriptional regulator
VNTHESAENYLETILILKGKLGRVRSADIVGELGFSRASVSVAMKKLRDSGHIQVCPDGYISFTKAGQEIAESMYGRHTVLSGFLASLGVDEDTALQDACRIEHVISQQSFEKIRKAFGKKGE